MVVKNDLMDIFKNIYETELNNGLKPKSIEESESIIYEFQESHYIFVNNVTIGFDKVELDDDNIRFYLNEGSVAAVAILNIEEINI